MQRQDRSQQTEGSCSLEGSSLEGRLEVDCSSLEGRPKVESSSLEGSNFGPDVGIRQCLVG
jgi:hypothetical protein